MKASALTTYLRRALDLAASGPERGGGPLLGWVAVKDGLIVDEGTSATIFSSSEDQRSPARWQGGTLFLSINPFATVNSLASFCASTGVHTYYVATDPNSPVSHTALNLNRRYLTWLQKKRPYIILKWAETADRFIARSDRQPYWISNPHARQLVHQWRSQETAIWVGKNTYLHDNPHLNVRHWEGPNPVRIVIDPTLQLNKQLHAFDRSQSTLCYNTIKSETYENLTFIQFSDTTALWKDRVRWVLDDLYQRQIQSVFVEGGAILLSFLLENGWWDEARVFQAPVTFGNGIAAPQISQEYFNTQQPVGDNILTTYQHNHAGT